MFNLEKIYLLRLRSLLRTTRLYGQTEAIVDSWANIIQIIFSIVFPSVFGITIIQTERLQLFPSFSNLF